MNSSAPSFLPSLPEGPHLEKLRTRFVLLVHGRGKAEDPAESWRVADVLGPWTARSMKTRR